jgi:hypothetical protein
VTSRLDARAPDECTFANLLDFVCDKFLHFSKAGTANVLGTGATIRESSRTTGTCTPLRSCRSANVTNF